MSLLDTIASDLTIIERDLGNQVFTWDGADYVCIPSETSDTKTLTDGGYMVPLTLTLTVRVNLFGDGVMPESQDTVTYNDTNYRIDRVINVHKTFIRLMCVSPNRGEVRNR